MDTGTTEDRAKVGVELISSSMPQTYKAIKAKSAEMGNAAYNLVRRGLRGEANCFWACERGHVVGTPFQEDTGINAEIARAMVSFGCTFVVVWPRDAAAVQAGKEQHGAH